MKASFDKIALGITDDEVPLGTHLIHFWHTDDEFERGVRFLKLGVEDESQYCVLFGHDEANDRVLQILRKTGLDLDRVIQEGRLVILRREASAAATLASIDAAFSRAVGKGAIAIRYLGNLGMGTPPYLAEAPTKWSNSKMVRLHWPIVIRVVIVCMYDINTVSGRLVLDEDLELTLSLFAVVLCGTTRTTRQTTKA